jgi:hypothetical protein
MDSNRSQAVHPSSGWPGGRFGERGCRFGVPAGCRFGHEVLAFGLHLGGTAAAEGSQRRAPCVGPCHRLGAARSRGAPGRLFRPFARLFVSIPPALTGAPCAAEAAPCRTNACICVLSLSLLFSSLVGRHSPNSPKLPKTFQSGWSSGQCDFVTCLPVRENSRRFRLVLPYSCALARDRLGPG